VIPALDLLEVAKYIAAAVELRERFESLHDEFPILSTMAGRLPDLTRLGTEIRRKLLPTGEVDESASPELRRIRREIQRLRGEVHRTLERLIKERVPDALQDNLVTIRNDRFVVPVRVEHRSRVPGVVHGSSSTGHTVFVEPLDTIEQNNELAALREREAGEIGRVLAALSDLLHEQRAALDVLIDQLAEFDFCGAKAGLSRAYDCVEPELVDSPCLDIDEGRHLLLEANLRATGTSVVPMTLRLDDRRRILVISGPNAGGKTVVLKTAGLLALMAQSGLHVPARHACLQPFTQVAVDIGDHQSLAANLSTFSGHVRALATIFAELVTPALVLLDEVGTGTDPDEGAALAVAVLERLRNAGAFAIASTHYSRLKMYASTTDGVGNAAVEFDEQTLQPTYRLIDGLAGVSSGIEIARRLGLPAEVTSEAEALLGQEHRSAADYLKRLRTEVEQNEQLRLALEDERAAVARRYTEVDLEFQQRDSERSRQFAAAMEETVREFESEARRAMAQARDRKEQLRLRKVTERVAAGMRSAARSRVVAMKPSTIEVQPARPAAVIEVGRDVYVPAMGQRGTVESIAGDVLEVRMGMLKLKVRSDEVEGVEDKEPSATRLPAGVTVSLASDDMAAHELNLIGRRTEEAREMIDKFLDVAFLGNLTQVRIVHGFGTGALKRAVVDILARHPHVASYGPAPAAQGGGGATIVELR
jgi:DNA mismatch repair protein MutS2